MNEPKPLVQCKMSSPCNGGTSWLVSFVPQGKARVGNRATYMDRAWIITEAWTNLVVDSEYIAWYINI